MTNKDHVIELIRENPFITQQEIAKEVGLSRSTVANMISQMVKEGRIKGRAYILNEPDQIFCLGAANIDRKIYVKGQLTQGTSNPISSDQSVGGVGRNIAENLGRLDLPTSLVTLAGDDSEWESIDQDTHQYVNLDHIFQQADWRTGSYTAVMDQAGDMVYGFADMEIYDQLTVDMLESLRPMLMHARCLVADLNLPKESLNYLAKLARHGGIPLVIVTVSAPKMDRMPDDLNGIDWVITNKDESQAYFNDYESSLESLAKRWVDQGVGQVVLTDGAKAVYYADQDSQKTYSVKPSQVVRDVTGAGDSFAAALIFAWLEGYDTNQAIDLAMINSRETIATKHTVRKDLTRDNLLNELTNL